MESPLKLLLIVFALSSCLTLAISVPADHRYNVGDRVPFYVNKLGPFRIPRETYRYFDLPFCQLGNTSAYKKQTVGEALNGDHLIDAPYKLEFRIDKDDEVACSRNLTREDVSRFRTVIKRGYTARMLYDDLPLQADIGSNNTEIVDFLYIERYVLSVQRHFVISYNKDRVVAIKLGDYVESFVDVTEDKETHVEFIYSAIWKEVDTPFVNRMDNYSLNYESQFMIITNSCITLLLLVDWLVKVYVRDFKKGVTEGFYNEDQEERGWKRIRYDVYTYPGQKSLLASAVGSGAQLLTIPVVIGMVEQFGIFYPLYGGRLLTALIMIYAITSFVSGYTSASFYSHLEGTNWFGNLLLTGSLFCGPLLLSFCLHNAIIAFSYNPSSVDLSLGTVTELLLIWIVIAFPLLIAGGICGKRSTKRRALCQSISKDDLESPMCGAKLEREVPPCRWYWRTIPQMVSAGFFSFGSLFIHMQIMIDSIWDFGFFPSYSISTISLFFALLEMSVISAVFTAKQLIREDPKWWWRSFINGGSVGLYAYGICVYYYLSKSNWSSDPVQLSSFFSYSACICFGIFLMFGAVSFAASFLFIRLIYGSDKSD